MVARASVSATSVNTVRRPASKGWRFGPAVPRPAVDFGIVPTIGGPTCRVDLWPGGIPGHGSLRPISGSTWLHSVWLHSRPAIDRDAVRHGLWGTTGVGANRSRRGKGPVMHPVVIAEPYRFVPPYRGRILPRLLQWILRPYLRCNYGITQIHCEGVECLREQLAAGVGVLLVGRLSPPVAAAGPARLGNRHAALLSRWSRRAPRRVRPGRGPRPARRDSLRRPPPPLGQPVAGWRAGGDFRLSPCRAAATRGATRRVVADPGWAWRFVTRK